MNSLGILEVQGLVASIEGLDAMLKAAAVRLIHTEKRLGGRLVTIVVAGSVADVTAAVEAGAAWCGRAWQGVRLRSHCAAARGTAQIL